MAYQHARNGPPNSGNFAAGDVWLQDALAERFDGAAWQPTHYYGQGAVALAGSGGASVDWTQGRTFAISPTQAQNINAASVPPEGYDCMILVTSTVTSATYAQTFGSFFKSTGTLTTGSTNGKVNTLHFWSDGNFLNEIARTAAM